jgi:menaquinone-dependent protoporphyrinogen oxidase
MLRATTDESPAQACEREAVKVLVAHASRRGSTAEIAEAIAGTLRREGIAADCEAAHDVKSLQPYAAVVLGSAVYMKHWRGEARHFLRKHRKALSQAPLWVFSSGPVGDPEEDQPAWAEPPKLVDTVEKLGAREHVVFGGRLPEQPHGPIEKAMVAGTPPEHRDRRDWDEIRTWAVSIAAQLSDDRSEVMRTE